MVLESEVPIESFQLRWDAVGIFSARRKMKGNVGILDLDY